MKKLFLFASLACISLSGMAQSKIQTNFGGEHGESDFYINWKRYYNYDELSDIMKRLAKQYPNVCKVESIGKSRMGREQLLLTITDTRTGKDTDKPAVYIDGAVHGNEVNGVTDAMYLAWYLCTRSETDPEVASILARSTVYVLPAVNIDAVDSYVRFPNTENNPREPFRPVDDDKDGLYDEDMTEDVDGDGQLSNMYAEDANGDYRLTKDGLRFVRIAKDDWWDGQRFRLLGTEGFDNDGDGRMADDDLGGIDPNRVFPFDFRKNLGKAYPLSEPVTRNMWNFVYSHKNILVDVNYHNYGREIMYMFPPSEKGPGEGDIAAPKAAPGEDQWAFKAPYRARAGYTHDAQVVTQMVNDANYILKDYTPVSGNTYGETLGSTYYLMGAYSLLIELWDHNVPMADSNNDGYVDDNEYNRWIKMDLGDDAWVKPHTFDHPQLGKIWIGGTPKKHIGRTPPPRYMEDEAMRQSRLILQYLKQLPELKFTNPVVKKLANNLYQVEVDLVNEKTFPTASDRGVMMKHNIPDVIEASVKGGTLVEPTETKEPEETNYYRAGYIKPAYVAGQKVEFRTKGNSVTTFRYTVLTNSPSSATLTLNLKSLGGKENINVKLQ